MQCAVWAPSLEEAVVKSVAGSVNGLPTPFGPTCPGSLDDAFDKVMKAIAGCMKAALSHLSDTTFWKSKRHPPGPIVDIEFTIPDSPNGHLTNLIQMTFGDGEYTMAVIFDKRVCVYYPHSGTTSLYEVPERRGLFGRAFFKGGDEFRELPASARADFLTALSGAGELTGFLRGFSRKALNEKGEAAKTMMPARFQLSLAPLAELPQLRNANYTGYPDSSSDDSDLQEYTYSD
jgi:hypothetical protein